MCIRVGVLGHAVTLLTLLRNCQMIFQSSGTILHTLMTLVKHVVISREIHDQVSLLFTLILPPFKNWQFQDFPGGLVVRTRLSLPWPRFNPWSCDPDRKKNQKKLSK